jgi:hypothetical protein
VKRSPTPTPEINYEAECQTYRRHMGEDLIWRTRMQRQEYNLNQRARQLVVREAHLCVHEHRCDCREAKNHATKMRGTDTGNESGSE